VQVVTVKVRDRRKEPDGTCINFHYYTSAYNSSSFSGQSHSKMQQDAKEIQEVPSVYMGENPEDRFCSICQDKFEFFFNDDVEEWHLRAAVRVDGQTYHSLCYEDYKVSISLGTIN
jgi:hypothetical protein